MAQEKTNNISARIQAIYGEQEASAKILNNVSKSTFTEFKANFNQRRRTLAPVHKLISSAFKGKESFILDELKKESSSAQKSDGKSARRNQLLRLRSAGDHSGGIEPLGGDDSDPRTGDRRRFVRAVPMVRYEIPNVYYSEGLGNYKLIPHNTFPSLYNNSCFIESRIDTQGIGSAAQALGYYYPSNDKGLTVVQSGISPFAKWDATFMSGMLEIIVTGRILVVEIASTGQKLIAHDESSHVISLTGPVNTVRLEPNALSFETFFDRKPSTMYLFWTVIEVLHALNADKGYSHVTVGQYPPDFLGISALLYT